MHRQNLPGVHIIVEYLFIVEGSDSDDGKEVKGLESKQYASISNIMPSLCRFQLVSLALPIRKIIESSLIEPPHDHHSV